MERRLKLHQILTDLMTSAEVEPNVYFQPPDNLQMKYPAIVYERDGGDSDHADNRPYSVNRQYQLTVIDRNPDSKIPGLVEVLPRCRSVRFFATDNLNHDVYSLYF